MGQRILFFDGVCNLCNVFVDFLIRRDRNLQLHFAPLQGPTAKARLPAEMPQELASVVYWDGQSLLTKSDAILAATGHLPGPWNWLTGLKLVPRVLRDLVYDLIASNRYRVFGKRDLCRVPTPEERSRFLD